MSFAHRNAFCLGGVVGLLGLLAGAISIFTSRHAQSTSQVPVWSEVKWPFLLDQWGAGQAFRCAAEQCGGEVHVYLRAKIGFCRCATGVSDDDEIDRVGDVELIGDDYKPLASGRPITAGVLVGRARLFLVEAYRSWRWRWQISATQSRQPSWLNQIYRQNRSARRLNS